MAQPESIRKMISDILHNLDSSKYPRSETPTPGIDKIKKGEDKK